ncbi:MAG: hypothetical protein ABL964_09920 [Steroidobacteraceae bacterium]
MSPETPPFEITDIIKWLLSALGAVSLWVVNVFHKRLNGHEEKHHELTEKVRDVEFMSVGRDTYQTHVKDTHDAFDAMRRESIAREARIIEEIRSIRTEVVQRVDALYNRGQR